MNNKKLLFWSVTVAMGGFLFGFDTAVISGAELSIQKLWLLSDAMHGLAVAIALYGTVFGAIFGGIPADKLGRKKTLFWIGILYLISALGSALAPDILSFMVFRFIGGLGVGASSVAAPLYIAEIAPPEKRGKLVAMFQFNIVLGILLAYVSNYFIQGTGEQDWRLMLGIEALPALLFSLMVLAVPRSPRWLIVKKKDEEGAADVLADSGLNPRQIKEAILEIKNSILIATSGKQESLFSKKFIYPVSLAFFIAFFNQVSGINAIIYYAPRIFELTGSEINIALLTSAGIGLVNLIFTMLGMFLIDKFGRRSLMFVGSIGLISALGMVSRAFYIEDFYGVPVFLFVYIAFFAMSQGAVIWVFISEVFPNQVRAAGQSLGSFTHWLLAAVIASIFPFFVNRFGGGPIFAFFSVMMALQLLFVWKLMPETKNMSLEELEEKLIEH
jgi:MFS transporter, SP family, arabinose:H+ symporter